MELLETTLPVLGTECHGSVRCLMEWTLIKIINKDLHLVEMLWPYLKKVCVDLIY